MTPATRSPRLPSLKPPAALSPREAEAMRLQPLMSNADVARMMGISIGTAKETIRHARVKLREMQK